MYRRALQLVVDVRDLLRGQALTKLLGIENRPDTDLGDEAAAAARGFEVALLDAHVQLVAENCAQSNDWHQGQQTEARQRPQRVRSELFRGGHCVTVPGEFPPC